MANLCKHSQFLVLGTVSYPEMGEVALMQAIESIEEREVFHLTTIRIDGKTYNCLRSDLANYFQYGRRLWSRIKILGWEGSLTVQIAAVRLVGATHCLILSLRADPSLQVQVHDPATWNPSYIVEFLPAPTGAAYTEAIRNHEDVRAMSDFVAANSKHNHDNGEGNLTSPRLVLLISNGSGRRQTGACDSG